MSRRTLILFWGATAASVFFLGSVWASAGRSGAGDVAVFVVSLIGLGVTAFVAGRIAVVVARVQRAARRRGRG